MSDDDTATATTLTRPTNAARSARSLHLHAASWPCGRCLLHQFGSVLADLPLFLTAPSYRRWHLRWGSTPAEVASDMPGDARLPAAQFVSTRSITINAEPAAVWPWLVQVGCGRAGFYSNDLLDNLGRPSATTIIRELQDLEIGQWVPMSPSKPTQKTAFRVDSFAVASWMLWAKPDSTWSWRLTPNTSGGTRLVTRIHAVYDWSHPLPAALGVVLRRPTACGHDVGEMVWRVARGRTNFDAQVVDHNDVAVTHRLIVELQRLCSCVKVPSTGDTSQGETAADVVVVDMRFVNVGDLDTGFIDHGNNAIDIALRIDDERNRTILHDVGAVPRLPAIASNSGYAQPSSMSRNTSAVPGNRDSDSTHGPAASKPDEPSSTAVSMRPRPSSGMMLASGA